MSEDLRLRGDELQILLNIMGEKLELSYPPYGFPLLSAELNADGCKIRLSCGENDFKEIQDSNWPEGEMPRYNDLVECLLNAGVLKYSNLNEFTSQVNTYRNLKRNTRFSVDTNLLYHGFFTQYDTVNPEEVVIVSTVRDEIESQLNHKYTGNDISRIKRGTQHHRHLLDELMNRRKKRSRKAAFLAMRSYLSIRDKVLHYKSVEEPRMTSRENDVILVKSLKEYERENYGLPILLTADDAITDICEIHGIEYFMLKLPREHTVDHCTFKQLRNLILNLSGVFAFTKLNSTIIYGEFRGKQAPDEYKLHFLDKKKQVAFTKNLQQCRRLIALTIPR